MSRLKLNCVGCGKDVTGSKDAVIHVKYRDVLAAERHAMEETWEAIDREKRGEFPKGVPLDELLAEETHEARWKIHCDDCNPHWNEDRTDACGGCYWWSLDRCSTAEELLHWTAHLHGSKSWFAATNWDEFLYKILNDQLMKGKTK